MSSQLPWSRQEHLPKSYTSTSRLPIAPSYPPAQPLRLPSATHPYAHTLPPLSSHDYPYTFSNDSTHQRAQTSSASYNIPTSSPHQNQSNAFNFDHQSFTPVPRTFQSPTSYSGPQSWSPQTSTSQNYQFNTPPAVSNALPSLLPMPNGNQQSSLYQQPPSAPSSASFEQHHPPQPQQQPDHQQPRQQPSQQSHFQQKQVQQQQQQQPHPTHVVGSQGRRGILPSALGRPPVMVTDGIQGGLKTPSTPAKDSEGKFPCEHCNKNYLHAKHLKRHMLRRTATYQEELQSFSARASRASSVKRSSNGMTINSRTASGPSSVGGPDSAFSYSTGQVTPDSLTTSGAATPYSIQHDGRLPFSPDGAYHPNGSSGIDLSRPHSGPPAHMASSHHPHIMGSANGSRHELNDDLAHYFANGNGHDEFQTHYSTNHEDAAAAGAHHVHVKAEQAPEFHYGYNNYISK
ncbi:MAG: hypothetical protein Q9169_006015 [Polycauliona sp. 2 TL-2023]